MESSSQPLDALELARALDRHGVECVVIGGVAMQVHGHVRTTRDLDTIAAWTPKNMQALAGALGELEARLRGVDADLLGIDLTDPHQLYQGGNFLMHTRHGDLDVFAADQTAASPPYERRGRGRWRSRSAGDAQDRSPRGPDQDEDRSVAVSRPTAREAPPGPRRHRRARADRR